VFDGATVVDVEQGKLLPDQRVVIAGNRIQAVGPAAQVRLPQGAQVVAAKGKYLIPGLWDLHTHSDRATDLFYRLFIANGVTGIRDAGSPVPLDTLRLWRQEILAGTRVGPPRQLLSGQSITNYTRTCDRRQSRNISQTCVGDLADAVHYVDSLKAAGADMIKPRDVYPPMYFIIAAEARKVGLRFGGHTWDNIATMTSDSGASLIDHIHPWSGDYHIPAGLRWRCWAGDWPGRKMVDVKHCQPVAEQFKRNNTWIVPTLIADQLAGGKKGVTVTEQAQAILGRFATRASEFWGGSLLYGNWLQDSLGSHAPGGDSLGVLRLMQRAGVPILTGTDAGAGPVRKIPPGFNLHTELALQVAEGLSPLTALQSATLNPAKMWRATDSLGTVAAGKLADLVLLDADPLVDITNTTTIRAVVANGRYFDRAALDSLLIEVQSKRP
jgi:hypothetical protein